MDEVRVLQVAGFKNSGKTTLVRELIAEARLMGLRAAAVKHHGHGGPPEMPPPDTDSMQFFSGGAVASAVSGGGVVQLHLETDEDGPGPLIRLAAAAGPDIVLVEGFKDADLEKIVIARSAEDWQELKGLKNIVLAVVPGGIRTGTASAEWGNKEEIRGWFGRWWEGGTGHVRL
ncbi:molybdopterin-guanine dinucleotide biosynthesis protein B [Bhargavaea cecembensis]|uniref:molybdopterin-guanine dinucleotide biosynthesis protein B n=2 Tax=Bhargavaea cecembensis TaxID=394098 RepID=UPI000693C117|nr:molybdopterin-guanine dinucleotide biosynthesis protein B [Bhargavaea cecembensis]